MSETRQPTADLRHDPRVAMSVTDPANPYRRAVIQARVVEVRPDEGCRYMDPISVKYTNAPFPSRGPGPAGPGTSLRDGGAVLLRAHSPDTLERDAEREWAAIADLSRDRTDRRIGLAQQISGQREPPSREERHRRLANHVNNLSADDGRMVRDIWGINYKRLVQIKRRYDPDNIFRLNHNIDPAG